MKKRGRREQFREGGRIGAVVDPKVRGKERKREGPERKESGKGSEGE